MNFKLDIPTRIYFGTKILEKALKEESENIFGNVLIVTAPRLKMQGFFNRIKNCLSQIDRVESVNVFDEITANPKVEEINNGIYQALLNHTTVVIGVGGGSAMDAAKAIAVGVGAGEKIDRYFFDEISPGKNTLPIIAIPTTAGTGSELSKSSILSSNEKKIKKGVRGERMYPKVAIVDPELTYTVPMRITMETGFDVMAHAVESYISKAANPFTAALSEQAVKLVAKSLKALKSDLNCKTAREEMSYASMMMGINLGNASTALPHRMQYPIGALTDTGHGQGLIALYPSWIKSTYNYSAEKFNHLVSLISGKECNSCEQAISGFVDWMRDTCGLLTLDAFGLSIESAESLAEMVTGNISLDPGSEENGIILKIYRDAFLN